MKVITKMEMKPGMILGESISSLGNILYEADAVVDKDMINKLKYYNGIMCVTIKEDIDLATTHHEKIRFDQNFREFEQCYNECLLRYKGIMLSYLGTGRYIPDSTLLQIYKDINDKIPSSFKLLDYLYNLIPNEDELTYTQCLNSALLAGALADWISMNEDNKRVLILCGFYYDIGKWKIPHEILWKPGKLTEEEYRQVKEHPVMGYSILRNNFNLNEHVKNAAIMHHERFDGSGYPYRMSGTKIDIFARYIAIIDTYIAMASPRTYRPAFTPLQILGHFEANMDKYDTELLMPIMKRVADAQIGTNVQLSDDSVWEVFIIHPNKFSRPILKNDKNDILDLFTTPTLEIVKYI